MKVIQTNGSSACLLPPSVQVQWLPCLYLSWEQCGTSPASSLVLIEGCALCWSWKPGRQACAFGLRLQKVLPQHRQETHTHTARRGNAKGRLLASTANGHTHPNVNASAAPERNAKPSLWRTHCAQAALTAGQQQETGGCWETGGAVHTTGQHFTEYSSIRVETLPKLKNLRADSNPPVTEH